MMPAESIIVFLICWWLSKWVAWLSENRRWNYKSSYECIWHYATCWRRIRQLISHLQKGKVDISLPSCDTCLAYRNKNNTPPELFQQNCMLIKQNLLAEVWAMLYTDESKDEIGNTVNAVLNNNNQVSKLDSLHNNATIFSTESCAIYQTLKTAEPSYFHQHLSKIFTPTQNKYPIE